MGFPRPRLGGRVVKGLGAACAPLALVAGLVGPVRQASAAIPAWTTYHHDGARSGIDPDSTTPLPPARLWETGALDGSVWGEPLVYGSTLYVATENDTIYALDAGSGTIRWEAHLGTPVPSSELECGDISPTVGITSTPVIDPLTNTIYAVMDAWDGSDPSTIHHYLVALDLGTGAMHPNFPLPVDPPFPAGGDAAHQLQRQGLALSGGQVVIGYGGNDGDCGTYWGWMVSAPESGSGPEYHFQVEEEAGHHGGAIWGAGNAPAVDSGGYLYAATGNGYSGGHFDHSESVLRLEPDMHLIEYWAPANWLELDEGDGDLGSSNPVVLPNGLVFQIGKSGEAVLLRPGAFGGIGGAPAASIQVCGSWGGGIYVPASATSGTLYITCLGSGLHAIAVNELNAPEPQLSELSGWSVPGNAIGPPIFAGGLVWSTHWRETVAEEGGVLYGIDPRTGEVKVQEELGAFEHFVTPSAGGGRLFVANNNRVTALDIAVPPAPTPTTTTLTASPDFVKKGQLVTLTAAVAPLPDSGTVAFSAIGRTISGCGEVHVSLASGGKASCQTSFSEAGTYTLAATYSGDSYYARSRSAEPALTVSAESALRRGLLSGLRESRRRWREGRAAARISALATRSARAVGRRHGHARRRAPVGTTFRFALTEKAAVRFSFTQAVRGRRAGRRCLALIKLHGRAHAHGRRCTRTLTVAALRFSAHAGVNRVRFEGRVSHGKALRPGRYTLVVVAYAPSGLRSQGQRVGFTIVRG